MTASAPPAGSVAEDIRLARLHLRMGQLVLARAELEELATRHEAAPDLLAALAEARWRTGDPAGAATAARAHLDAGGAEPIALCIGAESAAADGDAETARELMARLGPPDAAALDRLFAGMPQRAFWPTATDRSDLTEAASTGIPGSRARPTAVPGPREVLDALGQPGASAGGARPGMARPDRERRARVARDAADELRRARDELGIRPDRALVRLALVLRLDPSLAPAVLDAVALRREPAAALLRGDAHRLLGRHLEAEAAFDAAAETLEAT